MKQHITVEQLQELSYKQAIKLDKIIISTSYEGGIYNDGIDGMFLPLLSIGQMVEFLVGKQRNLCIRFLLNENDCLDTKNLCDALWEAVKEVLEGK